MEGIGKVMTYLLGTERFLRNLSDHKEEFYLVVSNTGFIGFHMPDSDRIGAICYHCGAHVCVRRNAHGNTCPIKQKDVRLVERHLKYDDLDDLIKTGKQLRHWTNFQESIKYGAEPIISEHFDEGVMSPAK